jgi:hypothetical protein
MGSQGLIQSSSSYEIFFDRRRLRYYFNISDVDNNYIAISEEQ